MKQKTEALSHRLLDQIYTTDTLKLISDTLEQLSQDKTFKLHTTAIVSDSSLTITQKKTQLQYIFRAVEVPLLYDFFSDLLTARTMWLFDGSKIDYFDKFVQSFQLATEEIEILFLTTAVKISTSHLKQIAKDISKTFGYKVIVKHEINAAILGGAQARIENMVLDMSLRAKFKQFEEMWLASLEKNEARIGRNQE